jgi:Tripartite tricarboxylate transporter TctB family
MQKLLDRDLLAGVILFAIGAIAWANAGSDLMNWAFPLMATYFVLFAGALLIGRALFAVVAGSVLDLIGVGAEDRVVWLDILTFLAIALCYLLVMYGLGFWLASFVMLALVSLYLTKNKTRHNVALAIITPLAACIVAYFVFEEVFYVPLPDPTWWGIFG